MRATHARLRATWDQVGLAALLLIGVLLITYGYAQASRVALYAGLFITIAGVLMGVVRMLTSGGR